MHFLVKYFMQFFHLHSVLSQGAPYHNKLLYCVIKLNQSTLVNEHQKHRFSMWISVLWTWAPWHILWTPGRWGLDRSAVRGCGVLQGTGSHPTQLGIPFPHLIVFHSVKIILSIINFKRLVRNYYTTDDWQSILLNLWAPFRLKQ